MHKVIKSTLAVAATAATLASTLTPSLVTAWGDSMGGRPTYTIDQINNERVEFLDNGGITFNSITDNPNFGNELNFVGARENTGVDAGINNVWNEDEITIEDGKEYIVRLYVHNNSPLGEEAIAENVRVAFALPEKNTYAKQHQINGFITASNATPNKYWDYVNFVSDTAFKLTYVEGSAEVYNNGFASTANGGPKQLGDEIINSESYQDGVLIGFNQEGDGKIPGCFWYANYVDITVKAEFADYLIEKKVRLEGETEWAYNVNAKVGDIVEFRIKYKNLSDEKQYDVMIKDIMPKNLRYVPGTIMLQNATYPNGIMAKGENLFNQGIDIGAYGKNSNAYVSFKAEVIDASLECGSNTLVNWGLGGVGEDTLSDYATVMLNKVCEETPTPELPHTGPATIAGGAIAAGAAVTIAGYYIISRRSLR